MLIDAITDFCANGLEQKDLSIICDNCMHPSECSRSCENCLEQVHYPDKYPGGMKDYLCENMIGTYVCKYSHKYASEIYYLLHQSTLLDDIGEYHIMSIGCGASPDLIAVEAYLNGKQQNKKVIYLGYDKNELWKPIHNEIINYSDSSAHIKVMYEYVDVMKHFSERSINDTNVIVMQYVISHFYNTGQIDQIEQFFKDLVEHVIKKKKNSNPLIVLINDANSCYRGRDTYEILIELLRKNKLHGNYEQYYFDYNIQNNGQRYGSRNASNSIVFQITRKIEKYNPWKSCSSAQMIIEVK